MTCKQVQQNSINRSMIGMWHASVTSMNEMFFDAYDFNQSLDDWNVASVTNMRFMFQGATKFNQCLSTWADETPTNYFVSSIFQDSGCPDKVAVANVAPWCQGKDEK